MGLWRSRFVPLCFDNPEACFKGMTTSELLRSVAVFSACGIQPLVRNADTLYHTSNRFLGKTLTGWVTKATFFNHFCAGEDQKVRRHPLLNILLLRKTLLFIRPLFFLRPLFDLYLFFFTRPSS